MKMRMVCLAAMAFASAAAAQAADPRYTDGPKPSQPDAVSPPVSPEADPAARPSDLGPQVAIAHRLIDAAGAFDGYMHRAATIDGKFTDGAGVARAVEMGSVYQPRQLEEGAIAYAALVALQDPEFVAAIQRVGRDPRAREAFAARLVEHPELVFNAGEGRRAATRVSAVLGDLGVKLVVAGSAVKKAAYDVQSQDWSRGPISAPSRRLARIKAESSVPVSLAGPDTAHLVSDLVALRSDDGDSAEAQSATRVVTQGLALAALAVLGEAGDDKMEAIAPLLVDDADEQCLNLAKLNEFQCLAVAGPHYEDMFCLGRHAMIEPGQCVASAAGVAEAVEHILVDPKSVAVPIAVASAETTERDGVLNAPVSRGVSVPMAVLAPPENYSPYTGPVHN